MRKFLRDQDIRDIPFPRLFKEQLGTVFSQMKTSVMDPIHDVSSAAEHFSLSEGPVRKGNLWFDIALFSCISPHRMDFLDDDELNFLLQSYSTFLKEWNSKMEQLFLTAMPELKFWESAMARLTQEVSGLPTSLLPGWESMETLIQPHVMRGLV